MVAKEHSTTNGLEKLNGLFAWWGYSPNGDGRFETQFKRFQEFSSEMRKASTEAFGDEMNTIFANRERAIDAMQNLVRSRKPDEFLAAEAAVFSIYLEEMALQAKRWAALTERAHECCATLARDVAKEIEAPRGAAKPGTSTPEPRRQAAE